ncbi:M20/M25/M40 family metallo-hydrolase [Dysosmobacter sp.]
MVPGLLIRFYRQSIQTQSRSDQEGPYSQLILMTMRRLGYDEARINSTGNVAGRVGSGPWTLHFDSHMDKVQAGDPREWAVPPFSGETVDGMLYGRGSVDMKGGLSASLFAAAVAKRAGLPEGKNVYVTGSVCEECCDGVCLEHFYRESGIRPNICVICEPSDNLISLGHTSSALYGKKCPGAAAPGHFFF